MKVDEIKQLIQAVSDSKLEELDYEEKDVKLHLSKRPKHHEHGPMPPAPGPMPGPMPPQPGMFPPPKPGMCPPPEGGPKNPAPAEEGEAHESS